MNRKTMKIGTGILLFINLVVLFLMDLFTIKMLPGKGISGNGNPALPLWFVEIPLYALLLVGIFLLVRQGRYFVATSVIVPCGFFVLFGLAVYLQIRHAAEINRSIAGLIDEYGWLNQYTNTIYLNYYSFFIGIFALLTVQSFFQVLTGKRR